MVGEHEHSQMSISLSWPSLGDVSYDKKNSTFYFINVFGTLLQALSSIKTKEKKIKVEKWQERII